MNRIERGFDAALAVSLLSNAPRAGVRLGAALFSGSRLLAVGANRYEHSHPSSDNSSEYTLSLHAEHACLLRRWHYDKEPGLTLYVARRRHDGTLGCSMPCKNCLRLCGVAGISAVHFYDVDGKPEKLTL